MKRIACGLTANVDAAGHWNEGLSERIAGLCKRNSEAAVPPKPFLHHWDEVAGAIRWHEREGSGGEYIVADERIMTALAEMSDWKWAVGGTGLQAAAAACRAGFGALVNIPSWSNDYNFLLDHNEMELAVKRRGAVPIHYIVEYDNGSASNRVILRGMKEFEGGVFAPGFIEALENANGPYRWLLLSGYNAADSSSETMELLEETKRALTHLGANRPPTHLELAAISSNSDQLRIIRELGPLVQSLGLNEDEIRELYGLERPLLERDDDELIDLLIKARHRFGVEHLIVHTHQFAACISAQGLAGWEEALRNGARFAAARAASGRFCSMDEIERWEKELPMHPRGIRLASYAERLETAAVVPALKAEAVSTVGLGDTFTSGLLLAAPRLT